MKYFLSNRLVVETGDITKQNVDAVVNAANSSLMGGGGVDGAIHRAGGPDILAECKNLRSGRLPDGLPTGEAVATTAGRMPARFVIHTVGPVWHGGSSNEDELLASAYRNSLVVAGEKKLESVAFPAISTGVYGFPMERAARIAAETIRDYLKHNSLPREIHLVFFSEADMKTFLSSAENVLEQ